MEKEQTQGRKSEKELVELFSQLMLLQMEAHKTKGHWGILTPEQIFLKIREQVHEAEQAYNDMKAGKCSETLVVTKLTHSANYSMILADVVQNLMKVQG